MPMFNTCRHMVATRMRTGVLQDMVYRDGRLVSPESYILLLVYLCHGYTQDCDITSQDFRFAVLCLMLLFSHYTPETGRYRF